MSLGKDGQEQEKELHLGAVLAGLRLAKQPLTEDLL